MAGLVNLRRARKTQERMRRQLAAAESRARHGRSLAERSLDENERSAAESKLDAHKIVTDTHE